MPINNLYLLLDQTTNDGMRTSPIKHTKGKYRASDCGRVFKKIKPGIFLEVKQANSGGYKQVRIHFRRGRKETVLVHRLIASIFIKKTKNKPIINHIDGNKSNNVFSNLEWVTYRENSLHAIKIGLIKPRAKAKNPIVTLNK